MAAHRRLVVEKLLQLFEYLVLLLVDFFGVHSDCPQFRLDLLNIPCFLLLNYPKLADPLFERNVGSEL